MSFAQKFGTIMIIIIVIFGGFCALDLARELNIKNRVIGYFYTEPEVIQINDFEFDVKSLLFTKSGNDNEYYATAFGKPVSNYDRTKEYSITINGIQGNKALNNSDYIDCNFTNKFNSTKGEEILTDTLNIKINFYKDETKIIFITNNGEQAVQLWTSYIAKNGFVLKIVEDNFNTKIEADDLPARYVYYYDLEGKLIKEYTHEVFSVNYPNIELKSSASLDGVLYPFWRSSDNELISKDNLNYKTSKYKDLHFYLYNPGYVFVDFKISQSLMNEFNLYYETERATFDDKQQFYSTFNFGKFYFKLKDYETEEKVSSVWPMTCYVNSCEIPNKILSYSSVEKLEYVKFAPELTNLRLSIYPNLTYLVNDNTIEYAGVNYPLYEILLFNSNENIEDILWGANSGYIFEEW